jgi:Fe-S-cluster containining protein
MANDIDNSSATVTANIKLSGPDWDLQTTISVPQGPTAVREMLPLAQSFADAVINAVVKTNEEKGQKISCTKGCGACCRQPVPITETEARHIGTLIENLPEPRRTAVRRRFAEARQRLEKAGLLEQLLHPEEILIDKKQTFALQYFFQGIPCPFLEDESCSIYADRPIVCREYLVTSAVEHCAHPTAGTIRAVKMPVKVWTALARLDGSSSSQGKLPWVPLILAPEWAEAHPEEPSPRPGRELLQELFEHIKQTGSALTEPEHLPLDQVSSLAPGAEKS